MYSENTSPMSLADFNQIIDKAEEDASDRRVKDIHELNTDIDSWI
jgi:hypothetical protein